MMLDTTQTSALGSVPRRPRTAVAMVALTLLMAVSLSMASVGPAKADTNPKFESDWSMVYRVFGSTHFTVTNNGKVTVESKATTGATNKGYTIAIQRQSCALVCVWSVVGKDGSYTANGAWKALTWEFANNSSKHRLRLTKLDDGRVMNGTVKVR